MLLRRQRGTYEGHKECGILIGGLPASMTHNMRMLPGVHAGLRLLLVGLHHLLRCCGLALLLLHLGRGRERWRRLRRRLCRLLLWRRLLSLLLGPTLAWPLLLGMLLWVVGQLGQHIAQRLGHESGSVMTVAMRTCTAAYAC